METKEGRERGGFRRIQAGFSVISRHANNIGAMRYHTTCQGI